MFVNDVDWKKKMGLVALGMGQLLFGVTLLCGYIVAITIGSHPITLKKIFPSLTHKLKFSFHLCFLGNTLFFFFFTPTPQKNWNETGLMGD